MKLPIKAQRGRVPFRPLLPARLSLMCDKAKAASQGEPWVREGREGVQLYLQLTCCGSCGSWRRVSWWAITGGSPLQDQGGKSMRACTPPSGRRSEEAIVA
jgi:hypothetical protein